MRSQHLACLLFLSVTILAQTNPVSRANQKTSGIFPSRGAQETRLKEFGPAARRMAPLPASGLNFAPAVTYSSGDEIADGVVVADLNGDSKPDIVLANFCAGILNNGCLADGSLAVLLGNGDGTFQQAVEYDSGGLGAQSVTVADMNGDGRPDIIVANRCVSVVNCLPPPDTAHGSVSVLLGNGDGTFQSATAFDSGSLNTLGVAIADVNADGKPDVVVASEETDITTQNGAVGVLLGNGDGTLQQAVVYNSGALYPTSIAAADVNGDGKFDLVAAGNGFVSVLLGNGDGTFQQPVLYDSGGYGSSSVAVTDVNGDARPDVIVSNYCVIIACPGSSSGSVGVLLGNGDGTFQPAVTYSSGDYGAGSVKVGDVNADALPDLLVVNFGSSPNYTGLVGVLLGNGDGTFQSVITYSSGAAEGVSIALGDLNADGKPDLVVADEYTTAGVNPIGAAGVLINTSLAATKTVLNSSLNPSSFGQTVTFTATVTATLGGTPTGTVTFLDGTTSLGSSTLNSSGVANFPINTLAVGTHSITASYSGDPTFAPSTSSVLNQLVQGSIVVLSPSSLNFGNQTVGMTSVPQGVILTNAGNITLTISFIGITGTNSADFGETNNCPGSLVPGVSCTISVTFTPTTTGTRTAAVAITDNAPGSPQLISLTGVGVLPAVTFSPGHLTFPTQIVFTSSKAQVVTLTNTGLGLLTIASITANGPFSETNTCASSINPGASCTISVIFMPTTSGVITGSVSITDNAPGSPQKVRLKGTGTYIQLTPASLTFGNQPVGTTSLPKKITLTNKGSVTVKISSISISGNNASDFAQTNTCGGSVAAGASCFVKVTFTPSAKGNRVAAVSVSDNGGGSPQKASLTGTGT